MTDLPAPFPADEDEAGPRAGGPGAGTIGGEPGERPVLGAEASAMQALGESAMLLRLAVEATGIGIFDYDLATDTLRWDARARAMFGLGPDAPVSYAGTFLPGLHPDDRDRVDAALQAALDPAGPGLFDSEYRTVGPDGTTRWLAARGQVVASGGRAQRVVGAVREITLRKTAEIALRATEARYRLVTRATNDAIWDWDLAADTVLWNEALHTAYGWAPDRIEPTGAWWLAQIHPDDRRSVEADIRAVIDGHAADWRHEYRFRRADGRYAEVLDRGFMVRGAGGAPLRMIGAMLDITERSRAEAQFRAVFEGANVGIVQFDPRDARALRVNAKLCAIWGAEESDIVGHSLARWTPDEDGAARDVLHRRLAAGEAMQERFEKRYRRGDGRIIWARVNLVSQTRGDLVHATAMIEDITEEKLEDARRDALIDLSDRLRDLRDRDAVVAATAGILGRTLGVARAGYAIVDLAKGTFLVAQDWTDRRIASLADTHPLSIFKATVARLRRGETLVVEDVVQTPWLAEDAVSYAQIRTRAQIEVPLLQRGRLVGVLYAQDREPRAWSPGEVAFAREVAERAFGGLTRLEADAHQRILNRELSHRLKNTLAMVQAIASQTLRNATDVDAAKEALAARLIALGQAHDILLTGERESAGMAEVIGGALTLHDDQQPGRFRIEGPPILIGARAALSLALMMHELATNAAKYGALSVPEGRVAIAWAIDASRDEPSLRLTWTEAGGPPVSAPLR
ncbi:MAG TPA: PAS domain S-box protein, partial [Methylobacterium sp.]